LARRRVHTSPLTPQFPLWAPHGELQGEARKAYLLRGEPTERRAGDGWSTNVHGHTHGNPHHPSDGSPMEGKTYVNVCVELTAYKPVRLGNVAPLGK